MAAGDVLLDGDGRRFVNIIGECIVSNGAGDACCCGPTCLDGLDGHSGYAAGHGFDLGGLDEASSCYTLDWSGVEWAGDEMYYEVETSDDGTTWSLVASSLTGSTYVGTAPPDSTAYYRVKSVGGAATQYACPVVVTTDKAPTLAAPSITEPVAGTYRIDLSGYTDTGSGEHDWRPNAGTEYDSVEIWGSSNEAGPWSFVAEVSGMGGFPEYYDDTGSGPWYRVRAINYTNGTGQYSAFGIASPAATAS